MHTRAWRNFKRTEDCAVVVSALLFLGGVLHAWRVLPGDVTFKLTFMVAAPLIFLGLSVVGPLLIGPARRMLRRYVWMSFRAGFGQSLPSILLGLSLLVVAAVVMYLQIGGVEGGGRYPAGIFSGFAAGVGILFVQAVLVRSLERDPEVRQVIEQRAAPAGGPRAGFRGGYHGRSDRP